MVVDYRGHFMREKLVLKCELIRWYEENSNIFPLSEFASCHQ